MANNEKGYLIVAVQSARGSIPLEGATVRIYSNDENGTELLYTLTTDSSGRTEKVELAAPPFSASQTPDTGVIPYADYIIDTELDGYYGVQNINAPIYSGVTSIQNVMMIPNRFAGRESYPYDDVRFNESGGPDL